MARKTLIIPDLDDLIARYQAGESAHKLGKEIGVKGETLARHMRKRGIKIRGISDSQCIKNADQVPPADILIAAYLGGESVKSISDRTGLTRSRVVLELNKIGVETRGRSEAEAVKWAQIKAQGRGAIERQCGSAWKATKGRIRSREEKVKAAKTHMANLTRIGGWENEITSALREVGIVVTQQMACGIRNIDVALNECRIAVEVYGTKKSASEAKMYGERTKDLIDGGWSVAWVVCYRGCSPTAVVEHLIAMDKFFRRNPSARGGYWVVDGEAQPTSQRCLKFDYLPFIPGPYPGNESP